MSSDRWDSLLDRDWSTVWETLPDAPELIPRSKTAQITLRLPSTAIARIKRVASAKALPYHAVVRSWIIAALRETAGLATITGPDEPLSEQLNIKLDQQVLDRLKARAHELRHPYHRLARKWIEAAVAQEEENLGLDPAANGQPHIKDLMVLLLHAPNKKGNDTVRGITRLQKLLFVIEQKLEAQSRFYAYNYGPFNEEVNDAAHALRIAGFLSGSQADTSGPPSFQEMIASVVERSGPRDENQVEEFKLNKNGHEAAERIRQSNRAYDQLYAYIRALREEWDTPDLVERVYEIYPGYTGQSLIREKVAKRKRKPNPAK